MSSERHASRPVPVNPGRRDFIQVMARCGLAVAGSLAAPQAFAAARPGADLAAVKGGARLAVRRAIELLGGMDRFVRPGQRVVVKPNIGFDRVPEQAANTNPEVVAEVVRMALEAGAGKVSVFDRSSNDPSRCYRSSGIEAAVRAVADPRVRVFIPDPASYVSIDIPGARKVPRWLFQAEAASADVFINCPVAKHHVMTEVTAGMKNIMGVIGGNRGEMHDGFEDKIVDLNLGRPSHLTVIDATRILTNRGPEGGSLLFVRRLDIVVAGVSVVAADAYATRFFGRQPGAIPYLRRAAERGLGTIDMAGMKVVEEVLS